jgi:hypothetical protein
MMAGTKLYLGLKIPRKRCPPMAMPMTVLVQNDGKLRKATISSACGLFVEKLVYFLQLVATASSGGLLI